MQFGFNHFCKLLVREEKVEQNFLVLNQLAAIISFKKMTMAVNIMYL